MNLTKITRTGDMFSTIVPEEAVSRLNLKADDVLVWTETEDGYRLQKISSELEAQMKAGLKIMKRYDNILRELSK